ncbi:L-serine ammonia-lyase, iron-sulfur-dependent, subunit beta [Tissierella creatinini]|nr:L-serine ammonia-lyase, iron-sulfur-dependent, subunit beta [Tissierella creatinini]TJX66653.1 L-serine ammonia-lyase, iron-sulfur-dependent, subunit beta [Soehngenia saccharolytica]
MKDYTVFDILGPVMIGPSSSHTAGAARLGKIAKDIASEGFYKVEFHLHGSFAKTYRGHGTDKALIAGILGLDPADEKLKESFKIAKDNNLEIEFIETDLGHHHPNTVKILFKYKDKDDFYVLGSSIGGGNIVVYNINGDEVEFTGLNPIMLVKYKDKKGVISKISSILSEMDINIATMQVSRERNLATMLCETDSKIIKEVEERISRIEGITYLRVINTIRS